jgi:predicted ArsR family transcriptional regulator
MIKTRDILIARLKSQRYTAQELADELQTSAQAIRYHLKLIEGLQAERIRVRFPNNARRLVTEYWLA